MHIWIQKGYTKIYNKRNNIRRRNKTEGQKTFLMKFLPKEALKYNGGDNVYPGGAETDIITDAIIFI